MPETWKVVNLLAAGYVALSHKHTSCVTHTLLTHIHIGNWRCDYNCSQKLLVLKLKKE